LYSTPKERRTFDFEIDSSFPGELLFLPLPQSYSYVRKWFFYIREGISEGFNFFLDPLHVDIDDGLSFMIPLSSALMLWLFLFPPATL